MTEAIVAIILTGCITLIGNTIVALINQRKTAQEFEASSKTTQAVLKTEIEELKREVRGKEGIIAKVPVMEEQIKGIDKRVGDLERKVS